MSDPSLSRIKQLSVAERRPKKMSLTLPPGLLLQLDDAARKTGLTPEQWLVTAAFEKLRRELYRQPKKTQQRRRSAASAAKSTPDFFLKMLRQRNRTTKKLQR